MSNGRRGELPVTNTKLMLVGVLAAGLLIGGSTAYIGLQEETVSKQQAGETLASTLEDRTGQSFEVVNVEEQDGMYRVQLNSNNQLSTYFVTKNGKLLANSMTNLTRVQNLVDEQQAVATCLEDKDAVMYGNLSQQQTAAQIQVLGGPAQVSNFYTDVNNPQNLQEAVQNGVTTVPAIYLETKEQPLTGVNNLQQIRNYAECEQ